MSSKKVDSLENKISKLEIDVEKSTAALKLAKEKLDTTKKELATAKSDYISELMALHGAEPSDVRAILDSFPRSEPPKKDEVEDNV